jgi:hypothetical protein
MSRWKRPSAMALFLALTYLFGGLYGLIFGAILVAAAVIGRIPPVRLWPVAIVLMGMVPFALLAQGLPSGLVVGPAFGTEHLLAHALVGMSLATCTLAGLLELAGGEAEHRRPRVTPDPTE